MSSAGGPRVAIQQTDSHSMALAAIAPAPFDADTVGFAGGAAGRGSTIVVIGDAEPALCRALAGAVGPTGLVVHCAPAVDQDRADCDDQGTARLRAVAAHGIPVLSHVADLIVIIVPAPAGALDQLAEECRRLLAPGGIVRALGPGEAADPLKAELAAAAFRDIETVPFGATTAIRARGPR